MPDIKIKRYADKENLKKLMKYSKDTFANKSEINEKFYTKEQIDTMLESGSGGGGGTGGNYYTKSEIDTKLNSKANDSDVAHKSGDETVAGTKTFTSTIVGNVTGNASTATKLQTARSLWGNNFDGSAAITGIITGLPAIEFKPTATTANNGGFLDFHYNQSTENYTSRIIESASGTLSINKVTITTGRVVTAATFNGALKGNVTGNCSGSSGSCTGNAATATRATNADHATNADSATRATSADRALAADSVQSQTSDPHKIRFDWGSQIPGYVGLRVDATDMGGIVTTNRLVSDIRAQWYAAYPDGAEAHNAMWGGRDITSAFDDGTVSANIADGTFKDIFPGDYITKQVTIPRVLADDGTTELFAGGTYTVNWIVADCDYWINKGDTSPTTAHHVVIVPQVPIFNYHMNGTNTTEGGYAGSEMYKNIIPACATGIVNAFGASHILTFRDHLTRDLNTSAVSSGITVFTGAPNWSGEWHSQQCNLMSEAMVYDGPHCASSALDNIMATRQMSAFRLSEKLINYNRQVWWLRDVVSSSAFARVHGNGSAYPGGASVVNGVRPFALLK